MVIQFFLSMVPPTVTHQEKKVRVVGKRPIFYEPHELKEARSRFLSALWPLAPEAPLEGALCLSTKWCWPASKNQVEPFAWKITTPDTDNSLKLLKDCMTTVGFWNNDSQVASEHTEKFHADPPGIFIQVKTL